MNGSLPTLLIISFSNLDRDPRVSRQISALSKHYAITAAGFALSPIEGVTFISLTTGSKSFTQKLQSGFKLLWGKNESQYWSHPRIKNAFECLKNLKVDAIIANDIETLPLALKIGKGAKIFFDAHEYAPREFEDLLMWKIFYKRFKTYLCKTYIPLVHKMTTVSPAIAEEYFKSFNVASEVITNAPNFIDIEPKPTQRDTIHLVCHSYAMPSRKLELLIDLFAFLDRRFHLDLILAPFSEKYSEQLKRRAAKYPQICFRDPVPMTKIALHLNKYDMGIYLLPPNSFNNTYALPNKFFEFIQARLAVGIGPSPEMAKIVEKYGCGIIANDFTPKSLAQKLMQLNSLTLQKMKNNAHLAARELCAENNEIILQKLMKTMLESQ